MKSTRSTALTALAVATVTATGVISPIASASVGSGHPAAAPTDPSSALYQRILAKLPADWQQRRDALHTRLGIDPSPVEAAMRARLAEVARHSGKVFERVIDPKKYQCGPTRFDGYVDSIMKNVDSFNLMLLSLVGALDMPEVEAVVFGSPTSPDFRLPAANKPQLTADFGAAQRFWDVRLDDVQLMGMHGNLFSNMRRLARVVAFVYEVEPAEATTIAKDIMGLIRLDPALRGGNHPSFTLNAFAFSDEEAVGPDGRRLPDKLVFGDGMLAALGAIGLKTVGPRAVIGHEMAHHVQFEAGLYASRLRGPEATRRTELMADSFGTYFTTHKKGLAMDPAQTLQVEEAFYDAGDCQFTSEGHHGTPNQRRAASAWGAASVAYAKDPLAVIPSRTLAAQFDKVLPQLVKPDAPTSIKAYRNLIATR